MSAYILKSAVCLFLFWGFYKLFLEKESVHHAKRFYLLASVGLSFAIPSITFTTYIPAEDLSNLVVVSKEEFQASLIEPVTFWTTYGSTVLWGIYLIGVSIFGVRFALNLVKILLRIRQNPKLKYRQYTNVLLKNPVAPHTFFKYIFFNKEQFENQVIPNEVILHEQTHARQLHAFDIILLELAIVLFWFNPVLHLLKKDIKFNHEFLADKAVLDQGIQTNQYQNLLLNYSTNNDSSYLANAINYSLIKKRFTVMKSQTSNLKIRLGGLMVIALISAMVYGFSSTIEMPLEPTDKLISAPSEELPSEDDQKSASREQMREYNELARKYNEMDPDNMVVKKSELERMEYIYDLMSEKQRQDAEPFPNVPPPPPPPPPKPMNKEELKALKEVEKAEYMKRQEEVKAKKLAIAKQQKEKYAYKVQEKQKYAEEQKAMKVKTKESKEKSKAAQAVLKAEKMKYKEEKAALAQAKKAEAAAYKARKEELKSTKVKKAKAEAALAKVKKAKAAELAEVPPPPPPPKAPLDHVIDMAKSGAVFYYEGKKISSDEAIKIVKTNKKINISTKEVNSNTPKVYLSTKPIKIKSKQ